MKKSPQVERWFADKELPAEAAFADLAEAQARAAELSKIVVAWCSLTPAETGGPTKPTKKVGAPPTKSR